MFYDNPLQNPKNQMIIIAAVLAVVLFVAAIVVLPSLGKKHITADGGAQVAAQSVDSDVIDAQGVDEAQGTTSTNEGCEGLACIFPALNN